MNEKLERLVAELSLKEKDELYRILWAEYVEKDVREYFSDEEITDGEVDEIVERYVYEGDYDCNLNYWDNLENLYEERRIV